MEIRSDPHSQTPLHSPAVQLENDVVVRAANKRLETHKLQLDLEEAWKEASKQFKSINRPYRADQIKDEVIRRDLKDAEKKRRKIESLAQDGFLLFQALTYKKYEEQVECAQTIKAKVKADPTHTLLDTQNFLKEETKARVEFHRAVLQTQRKLKALLKTVDTIRAIPCPIPKMGAGINTELDLVAEFLKSAGQMLTTRHKFQ